MSNLDIGEPGSVEESRVSLELARDLTKGDLISLLLIERRRCLSLEERLAKEHRDSGELREQLEACRRERDVAHQRYEKAHAELLAKSDEGALVDEERAELRRLRDAAKSWQGAWRERIEPLERTLDNRDIEVKGLKARVAKLEAAIVDRFLEGKP